jgi:membrane-associated phospholipid phosphatase
MSLTVLTVLLAVCVLLLLIERAGMPTTLELSFKGDIKRETLFLAQYGQAVATLIAAALAWQLDPSRPHAALVIILCVASASVSAFVFKRLFGRVRPRREQAGRFLGPSLRHANYRESFPSSHSACAFALSVVLVQLYPAAAGTFWTLAIITAALRYIMDAHYPSDVFAGIALGYACSHLVMRGLASWL